MIDRRMCGYHPWINFINQSNHTQNPTLSLKNKQSAFPQYTLFHGVRNHTWWPCFALWFPSFLLPDSLKTIVFGELQVLTEYGTNTYIHTYIPTPLLIMLTLPPFFVAVFAVINQVILSWVNHCPLKSCFLLMSDP